MKILRILSLSLSLLVSLSSLLTASPGRSVTIDVSDDIHTDTTWNADTVKIWNDIQVGGGATLTIDPGTYIQFQGHYKLSVLGSILAAGIPDDLITFSVKDTTLLYDLDTTSGGWNGIDFRSMIADTSRLEYCILEYGKATDGNSSVWNNNEDNGGCIFCSSNLGPLEIENCIIRYSNAVVGGGIKVHQGTFSIRNSIIHHNRADWSTAISFGYSDGVIDANIISNNVAFSSIITELDNTNGLFTNNVIVNNESQGSYGNVYINAADINHRVSFYNNVIANNLSTGSDRGGLRVAYPISGIPFRNNIIWNNQANGENYQFYPDTLQNVEYNLIGGGYNGPGNIDADPLFINPSQGAGFQYNGLAANWSLSVHSPGIDAGKPDFTLDSIGSALDFAGNPRIQFERIDMGAYEIAECTPESASDPENILINADFQSCELTPWNLFSDASLPLPADYRVFDDGIQISPQGLAADPQAWHIQLSQSFSPSQLDRILADSLYELTFDAFSDEDNRPCQLVFRMNTDPWTSYFEHNFSLGTEPATFTFSFTAEQDYPSLQFAFQLGSEANPVHISNCRLINIPKNPVSFTGYNAHNESRVYPNPASDQLNIETEAGSTIDLISNKGIVLHTMQSRDGISSMVLKGLPSGIYLIRINKGNSVYVKKVIIR